MEAGSGEAAPGENRSPGARASGRSRLGPLYERLPRGPHRLDRHTVARHQRVRIQGAMVRAVAGDGYEAVTVRQLIALAGVSRRSFYEQFASKQECFLATFDEIVRHQLAAARRSCSPASGGAEQRLEAALQGCTESVAGDREAAALVLVEAITLGPPGARRLRVAAAAWERLLGASLTGTPLLPAPSGVTAAVLLGGLHGIMTARLRDGAPPPRVLAEELAWWALAPKIPDRPREARRLRAALRDGARQRGFASANPPSAREQTPRGDRERLLVAALRLASREPLGLISAPQIADEASLPLEAFFELFADRDECLRVAIADASAPLLAIASAASEQGPAWPKALGETLAAMLAHLASHPLQARALTVLAPAAGSGCRDQALRLETELSCTLGAGFPRRGALAGEALVGALWHLVRCHLADRRIRRLPGAAGHLTLFALAPAIGADAAADALIAARARRGAGG